MADEYPLSFFLEWYDPQAEQLKPYVLHYHTDDTLELVERLTQRVFLKRIRVPTVKRADLVIGGAITVYSRQLSIVAAANDFTKAAIAHRTGNKALVVVTPAGYPRMGEAISVVERSGLTITNLRMVQLRPDHLNILRTALPPSINDRELLSDVSVLIEVTTAADASMDKAATAFRANGLSSGAVTITNLGMDAFASKAKLNECFPSTAVFDNCSLCLLRPRMVRESRVGELVTRILSQGFEISALRLMHLQTAHADELLQVYRGVYRQYQDVIKYMCSSPCVALEVRGDDAVTRFRELCGPWDVAIAQALRPQSLRAQFGKSGICNAVHCTDLPDDGALECRFVFGSLAAE